MTRVNCPLPSTVAIAFSAVLVTSASAQTEDSPPAAFVPYVEFIKELDLRRRVNTLYPNPQSLFDGLQVGYVNTTSGNLTFRRRDIVTQAEGPVVFARGPRDFGPAGGRRGLSGDP